METTRYLGLDVHAASIVAAVVEQDGRHVELGSHPNTAEAVARLVRRVARAGARVQAIYEAGPTGYALCRQLQALGVECLVAAPTLIPQCAGERVKTDRRDALKLARLLRSGDAVGAWVPPQDVEAVRDLVRGREAAKQDEKRAQHRLSKFLLRHGLRKPEGMTAWGERHLTWVKQQDMGAEAVLQDVLEEYRLEVEHQQARVRRLEARLAALGEGLPAQTRAIAQALGAFRGVAELTALTLAVEVGSLERFGSARQLMAYAGLVPSEHSSGERRRQGAITKTGNAHLRRVLVEAAHAYRHKPAVYLALKKRQKEAPAAAIATAWKAQQRLHARYWRLSERGKPKGQVVTAVARELLGFLWAAGRAAEAAATRPRARPQAA